MPADSRPVQPDYAWLRQAVLEEDGGARLAHARQLPPAAELGVSPAQLAIAWCLANPHVSTVILGASRRTQMEENLKALTCCRGSTPALLARVDAALR